MPSSCVVYLPRKSQFHIFKSKLQWAQLFGTGVLRHWNEKGYVAKDRITIRTGFLPVINYSDSVRKWVIKTFWELNKQFHSKRGRAGSLAGCQPLALKMPVPPFPGLSLPQPQAPQPWPRPLEPSREPALFGLRRSGLSLLGALIPSMGLFGKWGQQQPTPGNPTELRNKWPTLTNQLVQLKPSNQLKPFNVYLSKE